MASSGKTSKKKSKAPVRKNSRATYEAPSLRGQAKEAFSNQLANHIDDVIVVVSFLVGIISTLAIFTDSVGLIGSMFRTIAAFMFGQARIIFPISFFTIGGLIIWNSRANQDIDEDEEEDEDEDEDEDDDK